MKEGMADVMEDLLPWSGAQIHSLTPVVTSDPLDAVVGSAWDLVFIGAASSGCARR